jgi:hypothetical protein
VDINRRLNELLNQKDEEIVKLNTQLLELKLSHAESALDSNSKPIPMGAVLSKDESVMALKNRLTESERLQKEYLKEIRAM